MSDLTIAGPALLGLTVLLALLMVVVVVLLLKSARPRNPRKPESSGESAMLSMALHDAVAQLKAQERQMAARAEASERVSEQIIEGLTSGLIVADRNGIVQTVNPAARRILALDSSALNQPLRQALASAPALAGVITEVLESSTPIVRRAVTIEGEAKSSQLGVTVSPITGADHSVQAAVCLFTDLTAVIELEQQLRLKEALARLGELTAGLAHEFRNGLATIHGYGKLLDPATLPEPARTCVEGIREETAALGEIVTNFLRFARPERLALVPLDLRAIVERAIEDLPGAAEVTSIDGEFGEVNGDDVLLRQAFSNLIRNGLEACAETTSPRIRVHGERLEHEVHVTVEDNGPGIVPEALDRLFQPFVTTKPNGTGLGLAIVQKVIVSHNGHVAAGRVTGGGAQFRVRLPIDSSS